MKIKTKQIVDFMESNIAFAKKYPTSMAYKLHVNHKACKDVYDAFGEQRKALIDKYAKKDEDGNPVIENERYIIEPEHISAWNEEIAELLDAEVEVTISKIPAALLDKCEPPHFDTLSVSEFELIGFMIKG